MFSGKKIKSRGSNYYFFKNIVFFIFLLLLLIFVCSGLLRIYLRNYEIDQEIAELRNEILFLEKDNIELHELIDYFNSSAFIEEKARADLGLGKEGERVVVVSDELKQDIKKMVNDADNASIEKDLENPHKWFRYFFK